MPGRFAGKVAMVTGAGSGIGRGIALGFAREGAAVAVNDINPSSAEQVVEEIINLGGEAMAIVADVTNSEQVQNMVQSILNRFGHIDILVNNAGTGVNKLVIETEEQDWDLVMSVNAKGVFLCSRAVAREMIRLQTRGKIINISSQAGKTGALYQGAYCASKAAVLLFTQVLALELARFGINVNAVCPGVVDTPLLDALCEDLARRSKKSVEDVKKALLRRVPLGRMETPEDVAKVVLFLASEDAGYMTGQAINVTGGMERH